MHLEQLELVFPFDFPPSESWWAIETALVTQNIDEESYAINAADGRQFDRNKVQDFLRQIGAMHYGIDGRNYIFRHSACGGCNLSFIHITQTKYARPADWDRWVEPFFQFAHELISARVLDDEYEWWQIARDPDSYKLAGRSYEGLPMKWNNLPAPLGQYEIDISTNPGRRVLCEGYVEALGATMWLGGLFTERTGCDLAAVEAADWLRTEWFPSGVLRIEAQRHCFQSEEGQEGELQNRLRALLFPRSHNLPL